MNTRPFKLSTVRVNRVYGDDYQGSRPWGYYVKLELWGLPVPMVFEDPYTGEITFEIAPSVAYCDDDIDVDRIEDLVKGLNRSVASMGIYNFLREYMRKLRRIYGIFCKYYPYRKTFAKLQTVLDEMKSQRSILLATVARERFRVALLSAGG